MREFDGENLRFDYATSLGSMFSDCERLETINIPVLNAGNVTRMAYMFSGCSLLKNLTLSVFYTGKVTDVERMFYNCSELESLDLSGFNFSSVTSSSNMFGGASKLRKIILPNLISDNFSTILPAGFKILDEGSTVYFAYEKALKGKTLVKANDLAFLRKDWKGAVATAVNLREWNLEQKISSISFTQTAPSSYYRRVAVGGNSPYIGSTSVPMSNLVYAYVVSVGQTYSIIFRSSQVIYASEGLNFKWLSNMTSISLDNFSTYYLTNFNNMFNSCTKLASIDLSGIDTSRATSMNSMFTGCSSLTSLDLSGFNTSGVTDMGYMFAGCSLLTSLDLSNFNTARVTNMSNMFKGCSSLSSVNLSSFNTSNVTNMEYMFANCSSLTSLNVSSFNTSKVTSFKSMFNNCSALTELDLSSFEITSEAGNVQRMLEQEGDFALRKIIAPKVIAGYNYISLPSLSTGGKWCKLGEETVTVTQLRKEQEGQTFIYIVSETM
ncbi:MAG: BspA family leucine-rich repeat surface protein, partial [Eubacteriales bacterium]|nr:BspA family leucine-rich repeat surface protein [Eubacteriales bacterium]